MGKYTDRAIEDVVSYWEIEAEKNDDYGKTIDEEYSVAVFLSDDRFNHSSSQIIRNFLSEKFGLGDSSPQALCEYMVRNYKYLEKSAKTKIPWERILFNGISEKAYLWSYQIALKFGMDFDIFLKLLNSIDGESIDYRNPQEMIYALCIARGKTYEEANELYNQYKEAAKAKSDFYSEDEIINIESGYTKSLSFVRDDNRSEELLMQQDLFVLSSMSGQNTIMEIMLFLMKN